jgi:hypothetical protein
MITLLLIDFLLSQFYICFTLLMLWLSGMLNIPPFTNLVLREPPT